MKAKLKEMTTNVKTDELIGLEKEKFESIVLKIEETRQKITLLLTEDQKVKKNFEEVSNKRVSVLNSFLMPLSLLIGDI